MKYEIDYTNEFKKQIKKVQKRGKDIEKLKTLVRILASGEELESRYRDHILVNDKKHKECHECHIEPDWLLIYQKNESKLLLLLVETGSHSDLF